MNLMKETLLRIVLASIEVLKQNNNGELILRTADIRRVSIKSEKPKIEYSVKDLFEEYLYEGPYFIPIHQHFMFSFDSYEGPITFILLSEVLSGNYSNVDPFAIKRRHKNCI